MRFIKFYKKNSRIFLLLLLRVVLFLSLFSPSFSPAVYCKLQIVMYSTGLPRGIPNSNRQYRTSIGELQIAVGSTGPKEGEREIGREGERDRGRGKGNEKIIERKRDR